MVKMVQYETIRSAVLDIARLLQEIATFSSCFVCVAAKQWWFLFYTCLHFKIGNTCEMKRCYSYKLIKNAEVYTVQQ